MARKVVRGRQLTAGSSQPTTQKKEKDNAETQGPRKLRREDRSAGRGWKSVFTMHVTAIRDNLSRSFLYSNDSNGVRVGRKLIREMGMHGNMVRENSVYGRRG